MDTQNELQNNFMLSNRSTGRAMGLEGVEKYEFGVVLGQGTYGIVYKA
jgi:hypothetical protein